MITVQQLSELEEVIQYKLELEAEQAARASGTEDEYSQLAPCRPEDGPLPTSRLKRHEIIKRSWQTRLEGCQRDVDVWQRLLGVRSLVIAAEENLTAWLKFVKICQRSGRFKMSHQVLVSLMGGGMRMRARDLHANYIERQLLTNNQPAGCCDLHCIKMSHALQRHHMRYNPKLPRHICNICGTRIIVTKHCCCYRNMSIVWMISMLEPKSMCKRDAGEKENEKENAIWMMILTTSLWV
jgi:hypothetical protein